jgi:hypothetical protein
MTVIAENTNHADILGGQEFGDCGAIEMGTVGWDDGSDYFDQGGTGNDGNTLVKVQLFRGRDPSQPLKAGVAQGHKIVCQISSMFGIYWIPPQGTRVLVAIPAGMRETVGAALIVGAYQMQTGAQFKPKRVLWDPGPGVHTLIKGDSATLQSHASPAQFMSVGTPLNGGNAGVYALDETGSGFSSQAGEVAIFACSGGDVKSTCHLTSSTAEIVNKGSQTCGFQATGGNANCFGANLNATCGKVYLGNPAGMTVLTNGVAIGPQPGANSTAVFAAVT